MRKIVLASASPRRSDLLRQAGWEFEVVPAQGEERTTKALPQEVVEELALQKAREVASRLPNPPGERLLVLAADTVVAYGGQILGKPKDRADAVRMLSLLNGQTHSVYTGVALLERGAGASAGSVLLERHADADKSEGIALPECCAGEESVLVEHHADVRAGTGMGADAEWILCFHEETKVTMYPMTQAEIESYVDTGEPMDKAGAYGIQGKCAIYIERICGDYNNVVGLPIARIYQEMKKHHMENIDFPASV